MRRTLVRVLEQVRRAQKLWLSLRGLTPEGYKITVWSTGAATTVMFEQTLARSGQIADDVVRKPSLQVVLPAMHSPPPSTSPVR